MKNLIIRPDYFNHPFSMLDNFGSSPLNTNFDASFSAPLVNIKETDKGFHIELAAPGMSKSDFQIKLDDHLLTISAKKEQQKSEANEKYTRKEFSLSSFSRSFTLPETINTENVHANYENGVLKIELEAKTKAKPLAKEISIN